MCACRTDCEDRQDGQDVGARSLGHYPGSTKSSARRGGRERKSPATARRYDHSLSRCSWCRWRVGKNCTTEPCRDYRRTAHRFNRGSSGNTRLWHPSRPTKCKRSLFRRLERGHAHPEVATTSAEPKTEIRVLDLTATVGEANLFPAESSTTMTGYLRSSPQSVGKYSAW